MQLLVVSLQLIKVVQMLLVGSVLSFTCCAPLSVVIMKSKELKTEIYSHAHSLILSRSLPLTHSHTFTITCACCHDEIKGAQDRDLFSCSFSDSLSASSSLLCILLVVINGIQDLKIRDSLSASFKMAATSVALTGCCVPDFGADPQ